MNKTFFAFAFIFFTQSMAAESRITLTNNTGDNLFVEAVSIYTPVTPFKPTASTHHLIEAPLLLDKAASLEIPILETSLKEAKDYITRKTEEEAKLREEESRLIGSGTPRSAARSEALKTVELTFKGDPKLQIQVKHRPLYGDGMIFGFLNLPVTELVPSMTFSIVKIDEVKYAFNS
jgi:hypothetical protein